MVFVLIAPTLAPHFLHPRVVLDLGKETPKTKRSIIEGQTINSASLNNPVGKRRAKVALGVAVPDIAKLRLNCV